VLSPRPTIFQAAQLAVIEEEFARNGEEAVAWRQSQLALMGDVSAFMKLLKQRFSIWFNKSHQRFGTLWAERFKSTLIEGKKALLQKVAAYIDLNCVRAGLVRDPKDYRFCGYAEAVVGNEKARAGIRSVVGGNSWSDAQAHYRELIFGTGAGPGTLATLRLEEFQRIVAEGGRLPLAVVLRCRLRYLADGAVLGSRAFVETHLMKYRQRTGCRGKATPRPLPSYIEWGDIATLRGLRKQVVSYGWS